MHFERYMRLWTHLNPTLRCTSFQKVLGIRLQKSYTVFLLQQTPTYVK